MKGSRNLCGNQGIRMVHGGRLGGLPGFQMPAHLYLLVSGEQADTFEGLHPLREAGEGGWDFQEAFLQRGGEERLGLPHAALPGPLPQCCPGNTHHCLCPTLWGCSTQGNRCLGSAGSVSYRIFSSHSVCPVPYACWDRNHPSDAKGSLREPAP